MPFSSTNSSMTLSRASSNERPDCSRHRYAAFLKVHAKAVLILEDIETVARPDAAEAECQQRLAIRYFGDDVDLFEVEGLGEIRGGCGTATQHRRGHLPGLPLQDRLGLLLTGWFAHRGHTRVRAEHQVGDTRRFGEVTASASSPAAMLRSSRSRRHVRGSARCDRAH